MFINQSNFRSFNKFLNLYSQTSLCIKLKHPPLYIYTQNNNYKSVYMEWKKESYYDSIDSIHKSKELEPLINLKNCIANSPKGCIPISAVSKRRRQLDVPLKVARFLRLYPAVFEEFTGPDYNLPWFRLTQEAIELDQEEKAIYRDFRDDIQGRLKKFILMSVEKRLPLKIIMGMKWYLGLPDEYLDDPEKNLDGCFRIVDMEDGLKGLAVECEERVLSFVQRNAMRRGGYNGEPMEVLKFPLFPSKGRLERKISDWFDKFQKQPYVSPYEDYWGLRTNSVGSEKWAEKWAVGVLHEMLSLFVEHSAQRKKILCLRKYMGLPQKFLKVFERHPYIFYISFKNQTRTAILKEPYCDSLSIEAHPLANIRKSYIDLMKKSKVILISRRHRNPSSHQENLNLNQDMGCLDDRGTEEVVAGAT